MANNQSFNSDYQKLLKLNGYESETDTAFQQKIFFTPSFLDVLCIFFWFDLWEIREQLQMVPV